MSPFRHLARPLRHPWIALGIALVLMLAALWAIQSMRPRTAHDVSAADYAALRFDGLVESNGVPFGSFTITNRHRHPISFSVNNIEVRTLAGWRYYASWSPGRSGVHPKLGPLNRLPVPPGGSQTFLIRSPTEGDAWRIHVGVLRGIRGLTLENRAAILMQTRSPAAALTTNPRLMTGYHHFTFAGMLDGPDIPSKAQSVRTNASQRIRSGGAPSTDAGRASDLSEPWRVQVLGDGAVQFVSPVERTAGSPGAVRQRFEFGLPSGSPTLRCLDDDRLPMARTQWETNGIRYTQLVFVTRLADGELMPGGRMPDDAVAFVQVVGESLASEYAEAAAGLAVQIGERRPELELRDDRIGEVGREEAPPLALIEIPATGIAEARGSALRFRGSMPPGTSGSMTLKIPLQRLPAGADLGPLRELEFDAELRRVKRYWSDRVRPGTTSALPLALATETPERVSGDF